MSAWTPDLVPDQSGRVAIVTGANTGIGYETALALVRRGARVVLACRSPTRGRGAVERMAAAAAEQHGGTAELELLDLARLDTVRDFARRVREAHRRLDLLVNNAAVMIPPFERTDAGIELQMAVNHFGHFALTGLLLDALKATPGSRVVTVSSTAHRRGRIDFGNLRGEKRYVAFREYAQSKLANLLFTLELQRRLDRAGHGTISVAAHPGWVPTDLQRHRRWVQAAVRLWSHDARAGAAPVLYAATAPEVEPGGYYGPDGFLEYRGTPAPAQVHPRARNTETAERLWRVSEDVTGVRYLSGGGARKPD